MKQFQMNDVDYQAHSLNMQNDRVMRAWLRLGACIVANNEAEFLEAYSPGRRSKMNTKHGIWQTLKRTYKENE